MVSIVAKKSVACVKSVVFLLSFAISTYSHSDILEKVVVTAQKREQSIQDVGVAVTVFSGDAIKELGITNSIDLAAQTPGLNFGTPVGEGNNASITMRGVGLNDFNDNNEGPVAVYIDDVYKAALPGLTFQLFDVERVEILKGPQGTLYGRNTTGGLIHFITRKPHEEAGANIEAGYSSYNTVKTEGFINAAITNNAYARLSFSSHDSSGYVENRIGEDTNAVDSYAARLQLLFPVSGQFEALFSANIVQSGANAPAYQHQVTTTASDGITSIAAAGLDGLGYRDTDGDNFAGDYDRVGKLNIDTGGLSAKLTYGLDRITLTSISGYDVVDKFHEEDSDVGPNPFIEPTFTSNTKTFTQELRLNGNTARTNWIAGFYYMNNESRVRNRLDTSNLMFVDFRVEADQETDAYSVFGQIDYDLTDEWTVIGGLRLYTEQKGYELTNIDVNGVVTAPYVFNSSTVGDLAEQDRQNVNGRLGFDYRPNDDLLLYGAISRGTKVAGFNLGFPDLTGAFGTNPLDTIPYDEEDLRSLEVGFKSTLMDGLTRLNVSVYYYDYRDFQALSFQGVTQTIFNTDAEVYGVEFDITIYPWRGWEFLLGGNLMNATAKDIAAQDGVTVRDRQMVLAPDLSLNGLARYEWAALGGALTAQADFNFQTEIFFDIQNHPISSQEAHAVGNVRLTYTTEDERGKIAVFVNNVADQEYKVYTFDFTSSFNFNQQFYAPPPWVGVTLSYNFD